MNRWMHAGISLVLIFLFVGCGDSAAEPLVLTEAQNGESISLIKGEELILKLSGNPTTGYSWDIPQDIAENLSLQDSTYTPASGAIGSGGHYTYKFQAIKAGTVEVKMTYSRSWETTPEDNAFTLTVIIQEPGEENAAALEGTSWKLESSSNRSLQPTAFNITAQFTDGTVAGHSAVNNYKGSYTASDNGTLSIGPVAGTLMAGEEPAMNAEQIYLQLLQEAHQYRIESQQLTLSSESGRELLVYQASE